MLAFIPLCGSLLCRSWWSKFVVNDRQQNPPHLALCSSRVKVRTKVSRELPDRISCTKVISYLALACELECVYHDILSCWRTEWSWLQVSSCHVARLGDFEKYYYKIVHGLTLLHGSLRVAHNFLSAFISISPHRFWWYLWSFDGWGRMSSAWPKSIARSKIGSTGVYSYLRLIRLVHR